VAVAGLSLRCVFEDLFSLNLMEALYRDLMGGSDLHMLRPRRQYSHSISKIDAGSLVISFLEKTAAKDFLR
jgi:hypothetical protein